MIHKYQLGDYRILLDVWSGAVHLIDAVSYAIVDAITLPMTEECPHSMFAQFPEFSKEEIEESYREFYQLYQEGSLFSEDDYEAFADCMTDAPIKAMCLHIAHDCNLRCGYCFASTGDFGHGRKLMTEETGKQAIDFLLTHSGTRKNLELDFFGGEPLMNFKVIQKIVAYAREREKEYGKHFRFTVTTNGILLDEEKISYLNEEMNNIVLSLDGRKEVNDRMRPRVDQSGSYDKIVPLYQQLVSGRGKKDYYVRGTFTKYNLDFSKDVMQMHQLGFRQLSIEPVVSDPREPYAITRKELPRIFEEYDRLAEQLIEKKKKGEEINFFHFMIDLAQGPCAIKRLRGCGCGNEDVAVTPDGDIYPCHQFVGKEEWKMGNLSTGIVDSEKKRFFAHTTIYDKPKCQECWAKFYCSGGCNANNLEFAGDIFSPYELGCEMEKKRVEVAIMIQAALAEQKEDM